MKTVVDAVPVVMMRLVDGVHVEVIVVCRQTGAGKDRKTDRRCSASD